MFRTGFLPIIRSLVLYTQQWVYAIRVMLTGSILIPLASSQHNPYGIYLLLCMQY